MKVTEHGQMKVYTVSDCVRIIGVSKATIRNYSSAYKPHFSSGANPMIGGTRKYTLEDLRLLAYIKYERGNGKRKPEILESLPMGLNSFEWDLPQREKTQEDTEGQIVANSTLAQWEKELRQKNERIEDLEDENQKLTNENGELKTQLGRLEGEAKILKRSWWQKLTGKYDD